MPKACSGEIYKNDVGNYRNTYGDKIFIRILYLKYMPKKHGVSVEHFLRATILNLLSERKTHGYELAATIKKMKLFETHGIMKNGSIYSQLRKMEADGLILSTWSIEIGRKPRRVYSVTIKGKGCLTELMTNIASYATAIFELVEKYRSQILV